MSSYDEFFEALGFRESSNNYQSDKGAGTRREYLGRFQMSEDALDDAGYYLIPRGSDRSRIRNAPQFSGRWTGKDGVNSKEDYLNNPKAQERAVRFFARRNWGYIRRLGSLQQYVGRTINGIRVTESGLLAAVHLVGVGESAADILAEPDKWHNICIRAFLESNGKINVSDGLGTHASDYLKLFAGYQTPFDLNPTRSHYQQEFSEFLRTGRSPTINPAVDKDRTTVTHYIWRSRDDSKVRLGHQQNDDKIFAVEGDPQPEGGKLPGTDFGCRCYAEWILDTKYPIEP
jgi:hypothetical protein